MKILKYSKSSPPIMKSKFQFAFPKPRTIGFQLVMVKIATTILSFKLAQCMTSL